MLEFGLNTASMHAARQKQMLVMMEHGMIKADRINQDRMKMHHGPGMRSMLQDDPNGVLLEPGKSGEINRTISKRSKLECASNIPGHYESGMIVTIKFR